jgi:phage shock protein A
MGIFARLARLLKSNLNDLISRSEDPEKMLHQIIIDMNTQLLEAKKQVATSIADEKRLAKQVEAEQARAAEWEKRAMMAVRAGDDGLAREALTRKNEHTALAEQYRQQWQKQKQAVDQLKLALRALNGKIEEAKRKKSLLIARKKRAEAQKAIQETLSGIKNASAFEAFDRMEGRIHQMEAEAEAAAELQEEATGDVLALKFREMEASQGAEDELVALKRKMGVLPPEEAAPPATAVRVEAPAASAEFDALDPEEQAELERALAELEAEENRQLAKKP